MSGQNEEETDCKTRKDNIKEDANVTNIESSKHLPPDGGWGWVVVAVSFVTNFMSWGTLLSSGVFLEEFCEVRDCIILMK
jgi:hypothetical protein